MSIMPVPKFVTLYLFPRVEGGKLQPDEITLHDLGRFHFTKSECRKIEREKKMAFTLVDKETLPVAEFGRKATEPKIGVAGNGQVSFNRLISDTWLNVDRLIIQFDADSNRVAFIGVEKGKTLKNVPDAKMFKLGVGKAKEGEAKKNAYTSLSSFLKNVAKYDYAYSGNQIFAAEFNEKMKAYIIALPKEGKLEPRPVKARTPKITKVLTEEQAVNGVAKTSAPPVSVEVPSDAELVLE